MSNQLWQPQGCNDSTAVGVALSYAFRLAGGSEAPVRPPRRTWDPEGGSTSPEAAATPTPRSPAMSVSPPTNPDSKTKWPIIKACVAPRRVQRTC